MNTTFLSDQQKMYPLVTRSLLSNPALRTAENAAEMFIRGISMG